MKSCVREAGHATSKQGQLRAQANGLDTTLMVGKGGVTDSVVLEAVTQLDAKRTGEGPGSGEPP